MIISWLLWRAIQQPPRRHPLFQRAHARQPIRHHLVSTNLVLTIFLLLTVTVFLSREFTSFLSIIMLFVIPVAALQLLFSGSINGFRWAIQSAQALAVLRRDGNYDLLALTPAGPLGINWAVSTGILLKTINKAGSFTNWPVRILLMLPLVIFLGFQNTETDQPFLNALLMGLYLALFTLWFYSEDTQSLVLGGLTGMLVATYTRNRFELVAGTISILLSTQMLSYTGAIFMSIIVIPRLYALLNIQSWLTDYARLAAGFALLYLLREGLLWFLWHSLTRQLQVGVQIDSLPRQRA